MRATCTASARRSSISIANEIFIRLNENRGYVAGMASEEIERSVPAADAIRARQVSAAVRSARRLVEHRRQRRGRFDLLDPACARMPASIRRPAISCSRARAGRSRLRDLWSVDDARADDRQRRARIHARTAARRIHPLAPRPAHSGRDAGVRDQHLEQPLLGIPGAALRRRMPEGLERRARQGFQHALDRLARRRGASHPDARRRLHVSARHARSPAMQRTPAADVRSAIRSRC